MVDRPTVEACERYLSGMHVTLWGRSFNVVHPVERREAAEWLAEQVASVTLDVQGLISQADGYARRVRELESRIEQLEAERDAANAQVARLAAVDRPYRVDL